MCASTRDQKSIRASAPDVQACPSRGAVTDDGHLKGRARSVRETGPRGSCQEGGTGRYCQGVTPSEGQGRHAQALKSARSFFLLRARELMTGQPEMQIGGATEIKLSHDASFMTDHGFLINIHDPGDMTVRHPLRDQFYHLFLAPRQQDERGMKRGGQDMFLHVRHPDLKDVILQGQNIALGVVTVQHSFNAERGTHQVPVLVYQYRFGQILLQVVKIVG